MFKYSVIVIRIIYNQDEKLNLIKNNSFLTSKLNKYERSEDK